MSCFKNGDRVKVISLCMTSNCKGTVVKYIDYPTTYIARYIQVKLDNGVIRSYNEKSLQRICKDKTDVQHNNLNKGVKNMNVKGKYRVALVKFVDGYNTKNYAFALFDTNVSVDDLVLCDTRNGFSIAKVVEIKEQSAYFGEVTREIVCKVDFSEFYNRKVKRNEKAALKLKMDEIAKEDKNLIIYEKIAESNPEMEELVKKYKELSDV